MNFALILVILSALTGAVIVLDYLFFRRHREAGAKKPYWIEQAYSYFPVFFLVLILRTFLFEPFQIPSGSLEPTLHVGDFVVVSKYNYGLRLPVKETEILSWKKPKLADIAVFRWPPNPKYDFIKRVVGTPGDTVRYHDKHLYINGVEAAQTFVEYTVDESSGNPVARYSENLAGVKHDIYIRQNVPAYDFEVTVPVGYYFMMGDNRDDSADSRFWGLVPYENLRGKAQMVWMSWNGNQSAVRWSRIGTRIH